MGSFTRINVALDLYSVFVCSLIIFSILFKNKHSAYHEKMFAWTCFVCIILSITDLFSWVVEGGTDTASRILMKLSEGIFYWCGILICNIYLIFLLGLLRNNKKNNVFNWINWTFFSIYSIGLVITQFKPFYYYINDQNIYSRSEYYWISLACQICMYFLAIAVIFNKKSSATRNQKWILCSFIIFPMISQFLQVLFYGISFITTGITLSFFVIYIAMDNSLELSVKRRQKAISVDETRILNIQNNTITALANLVENRDSDTGNHVKRTSIYVQYLALAAREQGLFKDFLTDKYIELLVKAAPLHDIGKIVVPDYILKKPGKLSDDEFNLMKRHTIEGNRIVNEILGIGNDKEYIKITAEIATSHHEKWNGQGYPNGLSGEKIPLSARIMALSDVFDALVSPRCYKPAFSIDKALTIINDDTGTHFDPQLAPVFISLKDKLLEVMETYGGES